MRSSKKKVNFKYDPRTMLRIRDESLFRPSPFIHKKKQVDKFLNSPVHGCYPRSPGFDWRDTVSNPKGYYENLGFFARAEAARTYQQDVWNAGKNESVHSVMNQIMKHSKGHNPGVGKIGKKLSKKQ